MSSVFRSQNRPENMETAEILGKTGVFATYAFKSSNELELGPIMDNLRKSIHINSCTEDFVERKKS